MGWGVFVIDMFLVMEFVSCYFFDLVVDDFFFDMKVLFFFGNFFFMFVLMVFDEMLEFELRNNVGEEDEYCDSEFNLNVVCEWVGICVKGK